MRNYNHLLTSLLVLASFIGFTPIIHGETGDSSKYLTLKDTIFIKIDAAGDKYFEHVMENKQTLYSLAKFYGLNVEELYPYNPSLKSNSVEPGQKIKVPIPNAAIKRFKDKNFKRWKYIPVYYRVMKKDNLYRIGKILFHQSVDSVLARNRLSNQTIADGQLLEVGWISIDGVSDSIRRARKGDGTSLRNRALGAGFTKQKKSGEQNGVAFWQKKGIINTEPYCLHNSARVGSIMSISNPMKGTTVFAKVIGKLPKNAYGREVIIILAPSVAKKLGALDERFFVKIKYTK